MMQILSLQGGGVNGASWWLMMVELMMEVD